LGGTKEGSTEARRKGTRGDDEKCDGLG